MFRKNIFPTMMLCIDALINNLHGFHSYSLGFLEAFLKQPPAEFMSPSSIGSATLPNMVVKLPV